MELRKRTVPKGHGWEYPLKKPGVPSEQESPDDGKAPADNPENLLPPQNALSDEFNVK